VKRACRYSIHAFALLSLCACVATSALWVRSFYGDAHLFDFSWRGWLWGVILRRDHMVLDNEPQRQLERRQWEQNCERARLAFISAQNREYEARQRDFQARRQRMLHDDGDDGYDKWSHVLAQLQEGHDEDSQRTAESSNIYQRHVEWWDTWAHPPSIPTRSRSVPWAVPLGATAVLPAVWGTLVVSRLRRLHRRSAAGQCVRCGYDLRAAVAACPECGAEARRVNIWFQGEFVGYLRCARLHDVRFIYPFVVTHTNACAALRAMTAATTAGSNPEVDAIVSHGRVRMLVMAVGRKSITLAPADWFARHPLAAAAAQLRSKLVQARQQSRL
jgi:hypothetical protein